jgi:hypothetical protein
MGGIGKMEADALLHRRGLDAGQALQLAQAALHLAGLAGLVAEAPDEHLHAGDLFLLPLVGRLDLGQLRLPAPLVIAEAAGVQGELPPVELGHRVRGGVQEPAVVRNHQHPGRSFPQELLQPVARLQVQVVGRLIQQQDIGLLAQHPRQADAHAPALGKLAHRPAVLLPGEAQARQHALDAFPASGVAALLQVIGQLLVALQQAAGLRRFVAVPGQFALHPGQLLAQA